MHFRTSSVQDNVLTCLLSQRAWAHLDFPAVLSHLKNLTLHFSLGPWRQPKQHLQLYHETLRPPRLFELSVFLYLLCPPSWGSMRHKPQPSLSAAVPLTQKAESVANIVVKTQRQDIEPFSFSSLGTFDPVIQCHPRKCWDNSVILEQNKNGKRKTTVWNNLYEFKRRYLINTL